jgi:hypothetical protein
MRHHQRPNSLVSPIFHRSPFIVHHRNLEAKKCIMMNGSLLLSTVHTHNPNHSSIFMIRALPVGMSPSNLAQKRKTPHFTSRRFTGRHKRVSSGRHALRHYDHRFGEPWNGWKDCWKDLVEKKRRVKKARICWRF